MSLEASILHSGSSGRIVRPDFPPSSGPCGTYQGNRVRSSRCAGLWPFFMVTETTVPCVSGRVSGRTVHPEWLCTRPAKMWRSRRKGMWRNLHMLERFPDSDLLGPRAERNPERNGGPCQNLRHRMQDPCLELLCHEGFLGSGGGRKYGGLPDAGIRRIRLGRHSAGNAADAIVILRCAIPGGIPHDFTCHRPYRRGGHEQTNSDVRPSGGGAGRICRKSELEMRVMGRISVLSDLRFGAFSVRSCLWRWGAL